jgi:hypothetical protein
VLSVNDPRPLSAAVQLIGRACHCVITYEDPKWQRDEVIDISGSIWHRPDFRPRIPNGGLFTFTVDGDLSSQTSAQMRATLEQMIRTYETSRSGPGEFQVIADEATLHVVPKTGSVLDVPITLTVETRPLWDVVATTLNLTAKASGQTVGLGSAPTNFFQRLVRVEAHHEPARIVLDRALLASGRKLSWRLFYDAGMAQYYLSIHFVA